MSELARIRHDDSEEGVSATFAKFNMRYNVEISLSTVGYLEEFPWIRPSSYIQALAANGDFSKLLGGMSLKEAAPTLRTFWERYQQIHPDFELFKTTVGNVDFSKYIPFFAHADEGTGYKKKGVLIAAFQPALGFGSRRSPNVQVMETSDAGIPMNFLKTAIATRFLSVVCPKELYEDDREVFEQIQELLAEDWGVLERHGVALEGTQVFPILLGLKADWSFHVEAGNLQRSYRRGPKHAGDQGATKKETDPGGICHLCQAGLKGFDWEDMSAAEDMIRRSYEEEIELPWTVESPWTIFPYQDTAVNGKSRFYKVDIWHTVQLGVGKDFAASAMCLLVRDICASNIDDRFQILSEKYLAWCKQFQKTKYVTKLDKKMVGGAGLRDEPYGSWNKGELTVTLLEFLEHYCEENKETLLKHEDSRYRYLLVGIRSINKFMRTLYHHDMWIPAREAKEIAKEGTSFVKCYTFLAFLSGQRGQPMFALRPKLHMLHECAYALKLQSERGSYALNILAESCSIDEDFVGRLAFLARNVSPRLVSQRSIERYLAQAFLAWTQREV